ATSSHARRWRSRSAGRSSPPCSRGAARHASPWRRCWNTQARWPAGSAASSWRSPARTAERSALLGLAPHRFSGGGDGGRVAQVAAGARLELRIQLVQQRHAGGNVELGDVTLADVVE